MNALATRPHPRCQRRPARWRAAVLATAGCAVLSLASSGCGEDAAARRAARSKPIARTELSGPERLPAKIYTSLVGAVPSGRPSSVLLEVEMKRAVVALGSEVSGAGGLRVVGGKRLNHGSASRGRTVQRAIIVEAPPGTRGAALLEISWKDRLAAVEQRVTVSVPLPSERAHP